MGTQRFKFICMLVAASLGAPWVWAEDAPPKHDAVKGSLSTRLDVETAGGESDWRTDEYLRVEIKPEYAPRLSIRGALWSWQDLDGHEPENSPLRGLGDTYQAAVQVRPLYLYVQGEDLWGDSTLRVGRQRVEQSTAYSLVDGAYFNKRNEKWEWYAFLGTRGTLYDDNFADPALGAGVTVRPTSYTRLSVDTYYSQEGRESRDRPFYADLFGFSYPRAIPDDADTRQVAFTATQRLGDHHQLYARYLINDRESDEVRLAATGTFSKRQLAYDLSYSERLNRITDRGNDAGGFYRVLGALDEFRDLSGTLHIPFATRYALSLEGQRHDASGDDDYNRDYLRYGVYLHGAKLRDGHLDFRVGLARWDIDAGEGTLSLTGEVTHRWRKAALTLGTDYAAYQERLRVYNATPYRVARGITALVPGIFPGFFPLTRFLDERDVEIDEDVYSAYGKFAYAIDDRQSVWVKLTCQRDDGPDSPYWRVQAEYTIRF